MLVQPPWRRAALESNAGGVGQPAPTSRLPPEVLLMILAYLRSPADASSRLDRDEVRQLDLALAGAPRICRAWTAAATYELYQAVALPTVDSCLLFLRTVKSNPPLGSRVRRVALPLCSAVRRGASAPKSTLRYNAAHCPAMVVYSEILRRLPNVHAVRVQDLHVSEAAVTGTLSRVEELVIDNSYSACSVFCTGYPQILHAGRSLHHLRELTLVSSPWGLPSLGSGSQYHFPSLRVLRLRAIDAPLSDVQSLLQSTGSNLRVLDLERVRLFRGRCSVASLVPLEDIVIPVADTLEHLRAVHVKRRGGVHVLRKLLSLEVDAHEGLGDLVLPASIRSLKVVAAPAQRSMELFGEPTEVQDPWRVVRDIWSTVARGSARSLSSVSLHVEIATPEQWRAWCTETRLLEKTFAHVDLHFSRHIELASFKTDDRSALLRKEKHDWTDRRVFLPVRRLLKRTVTI